MRGHYFSIYTYKAINQNQMKEYCGSGKRYLAYMAAAKKARADASRSKATPQVDNAKAMGTSMSADRAADEDKVSTEQTTNEK
ncbi:hypothetical protein NPX13_g6386 [Xylaria arbuscula]|uniref:Uncharacterized protein n=1 Tax=Xylaria arbuscula TaxID=114810 RepID=A0A9W8NCB3_9PEZI|nr:hypothetical protein NPX13_g6386 [Xylaria arbuscula]